MTVAFPHSGLAARAAAATQTLFRTRAAANAALGVQWRSMASADDTPIPIEIPTPFVTHKIEPPSQNVTTTKAELLFFFENMYRMRRMEIAADMAYKAKFIRGFCHLYDGQEAICQGMEAAITFQDSIITSYRDHCTHVGRGGTVKEVVAELFGRATGAAKGIGGSMHMYKKEHNFFGGCGIVGAQIPLGAGLAFKHKYSGEKNVAFAMYGDGAANQGQKYEALNMAGLWDLPVIFVCENNHYGMGTATWRGSKSPAFYTRGDYVPGMKVDGMDVLAVKQACAFAKEYAVENGPIILEMDTYRYHGHSMSDPGSTYRTRDEVSATRQERDPIERVRKLILSLDIGVEAADLKQIEKTVKKEIDSIVEEAKADPYPANEELTKNIYKDMLRDSFRGVDRLSLFKA
mmetsp:Transcript_14726/g.41462  ORF Transcript_14726/g.41462 Transcript_14726/m.41462 type:complete len:404 (+) Transcript_14726:232-1443(+)|eukprot:CAMPEP_0117674658 /NCGR_PEP_ID=MMETSP0804-20121206/15159_1 /TAXON_ID=1074897 /ORGANISM="Tetraselmis astigmatica, Strain CCMP880" /LENGTH=403 /DNA_ID=CAMNT_0005483549 /DNA_START=176 /DNA_END=1387 /DNA_ORIENTATION=+